jgi:hypothetical protein
MTSRAEGFKPILPESVEDHLRHDAPGRIAGAQEQNVKRFISHRHLLQAQQAPDLADWEVTVGATSQQTFGSARAVSP